MNRRISWAVIALAWVAVPGCGGGSYDAWAASPGPAERSTVQASFGAGSTGGEYRSDDSDSGGVAEMERPPVADYPMAPSPEPAMYAQADPPQPPQPQPRTVTDAREGPLLIYTANISLAVHQVSEKQGLIEALATEAGGYLHHRGDSEITIRVPADSFQRVLAAILELGDVLSRDVSVQDVSEEFHDVQTRIRTLEAMYARVQQLLANATNVEHALAVEQHLERITLELERLRGRLRFLSDRVSLSTITVRFTEQTTVTAPRFELPFAWLRALGLPNLMRIQ